MYVVPTLPISLFFCLYIISLVSHKFTGLRQFPFLFFYVNKASYTHIVHTLTFLRRKLQRVCRYRPCHRHPPPMLLLLLLLPLLLLLLLCSKYTQMVLYDCKCTKLGKTKKTLTKKTIKDSSRAMRCARSSSKTTEKTTTLAHI